MTRKSGNEENVTINKIVLRHLNGSKANQVEEFPLERFTKLMLGRTATSHVRFDPDQDDLVSRQHAEIEQDANDPRQFTIKDLNSRNGTYVNKQRIIGVARIIPGDVVQLGPGGPEFEFDLDPRPDSLMRRTRVAEVEAPASVSAAMAARDTRPGEPAADREAAPTAGAEARRKSSVGKTTIERMLAYSRSESQRLMLFGGTGLFAVILMVAGFLMYSDAKTQEKTDDMLDVAKDEVIDTINKNRPLTHAEIAATSTDKVVFIEMSWKLTYTGTGGQVYHGYVPHLDDAGEVATDEQGRIICLAGYIQTGQNELVPLLSLDQSADQVDARGQCSNKPIGSSGTGSGFVVGSDGFIMTNRHVAANWHHRYTFPRDASPGVKFTPTSEGLARQITKEIPFDWIPAKAVDKHPFMEGKLLEGRLDYLDVTFAKNEQRWPAQLVGINQRHDVAMVKVNIPEPLPAVTLHDNYDVITSGETVTIMGYPGVSPTQVAVQESQTFERGREFFTVPDPTTTPGAIGRIIRGEQAPTGRTKYEYISWGDYYQLAVNETGAGNSGGPVFDDRGRVIGIYTAGRSDGATVISFAVPIKHGLRLMGRQQVIQ